MPRPTSLVRSSAVLLGCLSLAACKDAISHMPSGTFHQRTDDPKRDFSHATLDIDPSFRSAKLTLAGEHRYTLVLTSVPQAQWERRCRSMFHASVVEHMTLQPDPMLIGSHVLSSPRLEAGCGGGEVREVSLSGKGGDGKELREFFVK